VQSLVDDNRHVSKHYKDQLNKLDYISKQRLLYGNWEYDDSDDKLINYDAIINTFSNDNIKPGLPYITADIARYGKDKTVIVYWTGLRAEEFITMNTNSVTEAANKIMELQRRYSVPLNHICVDEDGIGGGVKDILRCKGFVNNSKAIKGENYVNLKTQCYYTLADYINKLKIYVKAERITLKNAITEELEQVRRKNYDKDTKLQLIGKDDVKTALGRSPDYADAIMMRMIYELRATGVYYVQ
tara:strand:- start:1 stop:729 length:729 start_codon:yes stop_codon:yes gene_type:complete